MKFFGFILINNRHGKYAVIDIEKRIREVYTKDDKEAAYAVYRAIMGASIMESWKVVKKWIKIWEGKKL